MAADPHPATVRTTARRGRPSRLSRAAIGDAALEVGFPDLTLVAVAERLGVSHAGLYTHVTDRDDLVMAAAERVVEAVSWPPPDPDWRAHLRAEAWVLWEAFEAHPGMLPAVEAVGQLPAAVMEHFAGTCAHLVALGFAPEAAMVAADTVYDLAADASTRSAQLGTRTDDERAAMAAEWSAPLIPELRPTMVEAVTGRPRDWFAKKLDLVLDGIATRAPR